MNDEESSSSSSTGDDASSSEDDDGYRGASSDRRHMRRGSDNEEEGGLTARRLGLGGGGEEAAGALYPNNRLLGGQQKKNKSPWWEGDDVGRRRADFRAIAKADAVLSRFIGDHKTVEHALSELIVRRTFRNKMSKQALKDSYQFAVSTLPDDTQRHAPSFERAINAFESRAVKLRHIGIYYVVSSRSSSAGSLLR